jgi:hypothetical protein
VIRALLIVLVIAAGATQSLPAWAQSAELYAAFKQYQALNKQGKYSEAVPFAQTFIDLAKKEFGETHQVYAAGLNNLAGLYNTWTRCLCVSTARHIISGGRLITRAKCSKSLPRNGEIVGLRLSF